MHYARKAVLASVVGYALDGFDLLILGFILGPISKDLGLSHIQAGSIVTWTLVGAVAGGVLFGWLADKFGRVRVLNWTILLFAVFTGLCALARGYEDLLIYRTVAGLGLGGEFGIGMALAAEASRPEQRARMACYVGLGWQAGVLAAALLVPILLPHIGWRGIFLVGVLPAVAAFFIRSFIGEPEIFLEKQRAATAAAATVGSRSAFKPLVADAAARRASLGVVILTSVQNFGYYGVMIWMPAYLSSHFGYTLTKSAAWTAITVVGMAAGIWLFGQLADRIGRRPVFLGYQVGAALSVLVYAQLQSEYSLLIGGAVMGLFVNGMLGGYGALIAEIYPTQARATAQNVLFNIGRAVGGFGPLVVGALAVKYSFSVAIALLAVLYAIDILATLFLIPERKGLALE